MRFGGIKIVAFAAAMSLSIGAFAQQSEYSRAKVYVDQEGLETLHDMGVCIEHGTHKTGEYLINDFSARELQKIQDAGYQVEILIEDVQAFYIKQNETVELDKSGEEQRGGDPCNPTGGSGDITYQTPSNWNLGSMGGYLTYSEFLAEIDDMVAQYPNIISAKAPIGNYQTHENRPIYWLRISDNPNTDEAEPELMYTSLIHAREPQSMAGLMFFMWYLLENYGTDPEVTYLVDNTEMYFVPMINPDGYVYNEQTNPNGGGMWRKNRRNNAGSNCDGVDLNRNFSYQFGASGISTDPCDENYLGTAPFSEPETQAIQWFCQQRDFKIALNYHSYGDLLLFPFGYATVQTPDHDIFMAMSAMMVEQSGHTNQLSADLYPAAGDSDDYMYADDLSAKPKIFAFTPEIGSNNQGFWPNQGQIEGLAENVNHKNLTAAWLVTDLATAEDMSPYAIAAPTGDFDYELTRLGLQDNGSYTVSIIPHGFGVASVGPANVHTGLNHGDVITDNISYTLDGALLPGQTFQYVLQVDNGIRQDNDTITKVYVGPGGGTTIFSDPGDNTNNWNGGWGTSSSIFYSAPSSITDSPQGDYDDQDVNNNNLANGIDLSNATSATLSFWARWDIEPGWDYCQLLASPNGNNNWTPLCGQYTVLGNGNQDTGNPLWDGTQTTWVQEEIDLTDWLGQTVYLRFSLVSDQAVHEDGFYYDDLEVNAITPDGIEDLTDPFYVSQNMPNPTNGITTINYQLPAGTQNANILIHNSVGQLVNTEKLNVNAQTVLMNTKSLSEGVYFYTVETETGLAVTRRFAVVK